ncbi:hypothetical protein, variant [Aphanomyces astaci]|uniref:Uncharacterized protein n=1 Tax=Aphanomyces astaci TaxID=112090 RepID=W4H6C5_APHAT|nr:hypothetical protein H257_01027 [Aphanomyces astaci]XP_009822326.1 hypothetical protein, variant [Aphanomyces astaci]ETV87462.1 hypothetical protein H257_01027 [Aphanomyces astaci]ETV87463.1 hypothetical protein, variant [Aphanomyces astaci]|eukprot:XP_009822325.1 hypothetical protein H257_01027 [Aphanomyces astaci]
MEHCGVGFITDVAKYPSSSVRQTSNATNSTTMSLRLPSGCSSLCARPQLCVKTYRTNPLNFCGKPRGFVWWSSHAYWESTQRSRKLAVTWSVFHSSKPFKTRNVSFMTLPPMTLAST